MLLSIFWYNVQTTLPSAQIVLFIKQDIVRFVWKRDPTIKEGESLPALHQNVTLGAPTKGVRRWIRRDAAINRKTEGGIRETDVDVQIGAIQAAALVRYIGPAQAPWKPLLDHYLVDEQSAFGREVILSAAPTRDLLNRLLPPPSG